MGVVDVIISHKEAFTTFPNLIIFVLLAPLWVYLPCWLVVLSFCDLVGFLPGLLLSEGFIGLDSEHIVRVPPPPQYHTFN